MKLLILVFLVACNSGGESSQSVTSSPAPEETASLTVTTTRFLKNPAAINHPGLALLSECEEDFCDVSGALWHDSATEDIYKTYFTGRLEKELDGTYQGTLTIPGCGVVTMLYRDGNRYDVTYQGITYAFTNSTGWMGDIEDVIPNERELCWQYGYF